MRSPAMDSRFVVPFAVSSAGGAAIVSVITRWWTYESLHGPYLPLNGVIVLFVAAASGALVGRTYERWLATPDLLTGVAYGSMLAVLVGGIAGAAVVATADPSQMLESAKAGVALALVIIPLLFASAVYARRAARSRPGSIVGGADRRAVWRFTATWLAVVSLVGARSAGEEYFRHDRQVLSFVALSVALVGWMIVSVVTVRDALAHYTLQRVGRETLTIEDHREAPVGTRDVGIGDATWVERLAGTESYREARVERVVLFGDAGVGAPLARTAFLRSIVAFTVVSLAAMYTLENWIFGPL